MHAARALRISHGSRFSVSLSGTLATNYYSRSEVGPFVHPIYHVHKVWGSIWTCVCVCQCACVCASVRVRVCVCVCGAGVIWERERERERGGGGGKAILNINLTSLFFPFWTEGGQNTFEVQVEAEKRLRRKRTKESGTTAGTVLQAALKMSTPPREDYRPFCCFCCTGKKMEWSIQCN